MSHSWCSWRIYSPSFLGLFFSFSGLDINLKWFDMPLQFELDASGTNYNNFNLMVKGRVQKNFHLLMWLVVYWIVWLNRNEVVFQGIVWLSKNEVVFQGTIFRIIEMVDRAKVLTCNWFVAETKDKKVFYWIDWCTNLVNH